MASGIERIDANYLNKFLYKLPKNLQVISDMARNLSEAGVWQEAESEAVLLSHRADLGDYVYDIVLFSPLSRSAIDDYQRLNDFVIIPPLLEILNHVNGFSIFELNMFGIPRSMTITPPMLDRSLRAPFDLSGGRNWRQKYADTEGLGTLFASKNIGDDGQVGYFINADGSIAGRGNGAEGLPPIFGFWDGIGDWLASEVR